MEVQLSVVRAEVEDQHHFLLELDQSYLLPLIEQGKVFLTKYPVRGERP